MNPKIIFKYSWIYDCHWREVYGSCGEEYPTSKQIQNYMHKVEKLWRKDEVGILKELSRVTGLKWKEKTIVCYVVGRCSPFSDPLTMKVYKKYPSDYFVDVLVHELIHQLFTQGNNEKLSRKSWKYFHRKYNKENYSTIIHIPVHAVHKHIFMKYFGEERLKREIEALSSLPKYKKAWDIVGKEGYKNIIDDFKERIKG